MSDDPPELRKVLKTRRRRFLMGAAVAIGVLVATFLLVADRTRRAEVERLAELLALREGLAVGEIGAGTGWLTVEVAGRVGPAGRVYATELNSARLDDIRQTVAEHGLTNVTVLEAGEHATNLPAGCCDALYMRRVYHHLSAPSDVLASIRDALRPEGQLVIIEFRRAGLLGRATQMGINQTELVTSVTAAGFTLVAQEEWPGWDHYVTVFRKTMAVPGPDPLG